LDRQAPTTLPLGGNAMIADDHRAKAADCFRRSRLANDEQSRSFFLSLAQLWLALADEHVRTERRAQDELNAGRATH